VKKRPRATELSVCQCAEECATRTDALAHLKAAIQRHRDSIWPRVKHPSIEKNVGRWEDKRLYQEAGIE